jgi:hypothetical protein
MLNSTGTLAHSQRSAWLLPGIVHLTHATVLLDRLTPLGYP